MNIRQRILFLITPLCLLLTYFALPAAGVQYVYDDLGRVVEIVYDDGTVQLYGYDVVGNRLSETTSHLPNSPSNPSYPDGSTNDPVSANISWTGGDPDPLATVIYDLYLDTNNPPVTKVASGLSSPSFSLQNLNLSCGTTYHWQIVSTDHTFGLVTKGSVWQFTTNSTASPAKNKGTGAPYTTLQAAYEAASDGDTISSQDIQFNEDLNLDTSISVTLDGGNNCDFSSHANMTTLKGSLTITSGTVTIGNYIISN